MKILRPLALTILALCASTSARAATIAGWTFETSIPTTAGPHAAEIGTGSAIGFHASSATVYSNPAGNFSSESFSANTWTVGDYWQFSLSTVGYTGISVAYDQTGSNTGPRDFQFSYSVDGTIFTNFSSVYGITNDSWSSAGPLKTESNRSFNLAAITTLDNTGTVYFRITQTSATSINGGTVATAGTSRIDNMVISGTPVVTDVPEPATMILGGIALAGFGGSRLLRRRQKLETAVAG